MIFSTLVSTDELARHLDDPNWIAFDCRHDLAEPGAGERDYARSHVPGARFLHVDRDLAGPRSGKNGRHPLPDPEVFIAKLGAAGVDNGKQVIVYDAQGGAMCARLWWMLRFWLGHDACAVLDGGWGKWLREGHPTTSEIPVILAATLHATARDVAVDARFVLAAMGSSRCLLLDARAPERYRGDAETIDPVAGHVPGARNRFFRDNLAPDGTFKPAAALRAEYESLLNGVAPGNVVHHCGSGVSACHNVLAMAHAGFAPGRLYVGSWSEWCADPSRPVARGANA